MMNIYFSCSLTGGRDDEEVYNVIVNHLISRGHEVPTEHLARSEVMELEKIVDANEVYRRDIKWVDECDAVVAEVSTPSHGVGYEIAYALGQGKPVLCCHKQGVTVSKMILGNDNPDLTLGKYETPSQVLEIIDSFIQNLAGE
jgi:nucleoside 2-deoxyribosyltransferase